MSVQSKTVSLNNEMQPDVHAKKLVTEIMHLIESAKSQVASYANSSLVILYWKIGQRINHDILKKERAEYGEKIRLLCFSSG